MHASNPVIDHTRDLDALDPLVDSNGGKIRENLDLPAGINGKKQGIDDFFSSGRILDDVLPLIVAPLDPAPLDPVSQPWIGLVKRTKIGLATGQPPIPSF